MAMYFAVASMLASPALFDPSESCQSIGCGKKGATCSCDDDCPAESSCCPDYQATCSSCKALGCGSSGLTCSCDDDCMDEEGSSFMTHPNVTLES